MAIIDNSAAHCSHNHTRVNICSNVHQSSKRLCFSHLYNRRLVPLSADAERLNSGSLCRRLGLHLNVSLYVWEVWHPEGIINLQNVQVLLLRTEDVWKYRFFDHFDQYRFDQLVLGKELK